MLIRIVLRVILLLIEHAIGIVVLLAKIVVSLGDFDLSGGLGLGSWESFGC